MKHHGKGTPVPFFFPFCVPLQRDNALLTHALNAYQAGQYADALVAIEYLCRRYGDRATPAILRARILEACRPELASRAWYKAWYCEPQDPMLQDAMLRSWLASGAAASVLELGPAFLPERCRSGNEAALLAFLCQAGMHRVGACWKSGNDIEGIVWQLNQPKMQDPDSNTVTLVVSDETSQSFHDVTLGTRFRIPCPRHDGVWSLAFSDGSTNRLLQGSPLVFGTPAIDRACAPASSDNTQSRIALRSLQATQAAGTTTRIKRSRSGEQKRKADAAPVDILIPVYRGHAAVKACIDSVLDSLAHNTTTAEIIVIDDAGPEPALALWLAKLAQEGRITLLRNRYNLGFIETVNRGLRRHNGRDVILLNADTLVHGDWIDRLALSLHSADDIAAVTPWSNNGEITSFPQVADAAPAPDLEELAQIDGIAAALHRAGSTQDVELPVCCGFAMMMRRSVLDQIGLLDGVGLVRGYGEEIDWCMRARRAGYRLLACTGVFVAHAGTVSFRFEKRLRVKQNRAVIAARYPDFHPEYYAFLQRDPLTEARTALRNAVAQAPGQWLNRALQGDQATTPELLPSPAPSRFARIAIWHHRLNDAHEAKLLELARMIASRRLNVAVRLLVIGEASEALWHTGVVDVVPFDKDRETQVLSDAALLGLVGCDAVLGEAGKQSPARIPSYVIDDAFRPGIWLANWLKDHNIKRNAAQQALGRNQPSAARAHIA